MFYYEVGLILFLPTLSLYMVYATLGKLVENVAFPSNKYRLKRLGINLTSMLVMKVYEFRFSSENVLFNLLEVTLMEYL